MIVQWYTTTRFNNAADPKEILIWGLGAVMGENHSVANVFVADLPPRRVSDSGWNGALGCCHSVC